MGGHGGETEGPCRQTGDEGQGTEMGGSFLAGLGGGWGELGEENGVRPASGRGPGQPPASTARHEWDARCVVMETEHDGG